jgi:2,3,4,5-tetrahydropyridine-2-carboxylate N-succinyltransferase
MYPRGHLVEMKGFVPARSVVFLRSYTKKFPAGDFQVPCAIIIGNTQTIYRLKHFEQRCVNMT